MKMKMGSKPKPIKVKVNVLEHMKKNTKDHFNGKPKSDAPGIRGKR